MALYRTTGGPCISIKLCGVKYWQLVFTARFGPPPVAIISRALILKIHFRTCASWFVSFFLLACRSRTMIRTPAPELFVNIKALLILTEKDSPEWKEMTFICSMQTFRDMDRCRDFWKFFVNYFRLF